MSGESGMSGSNRGSTVQPTGQDMKPRELRQFLGSEVTQIRTIERPLDGKLKSFPILGTGNYRTSHSGIEIRTTFDNKEYTGHKGSNFGTEKGGNTVFTDSKHRSNRWQVKSEWQSVPPGVKVSDLIREGGRDYGLLTDNCHMAAKAMTNRAAGKKDK